MENIPRVNITTSYFSQLRLIASPVSIARNEPAWFKASTKYQAYKKLAPSWSLLGKAKQGKIGQEKYVKIYYQTVLDLHNPMEIVNELLALFGPAPTLLCWEAPDKFCHRRLVANWLEERIGLTVPELDL